MSTFTVDCCEWPGSGLRPWGKAKRVLTAVMAIGIAGVGCDSLRELGKPSGGLVEPIAAGPLDTCDRTALTAMGADLLYPFRSAASTPTTFESGPYGFDDAGVLTYDYGSRYGGIGQTHNPMFISLHALGMAKDLIVGGDDPVRRDQLKKQLDWLVGNGIVRDRPIEYATWRYPFPVERFGMPPQWSSSLAQGRIAAAMQLGFALLGDIRYCRYARLATAAMNVSLEDGGVASRVGDGDSLWFEEYAHASAPPSRVLNGHLSAVAGLHVLHSGLAQALYLAGVEATRRLLPSFDTGFLSRYSLDPDWLAPAGGYNVMHVQQLSWLFEVEGDPIFAEEAMKYLYYSDDEGFATASTSTNTDRNGPDKIAMAFGNSYWSSTRLPVDVSWHLDTPQITDGISIVGYFLNPQALPRDVAIEVYGEGQSVVHRASITDNEAPWFTVTWPPVTTTAIRMNFTKSNGWGGVGLTGLRARHVGPRTGFLASPHGVRAPNLPHHMGDSRGWVPPVSDGWLLIRPVHSRGGTLHVSPCPDTLRLGWFAGAALDELVPAGVEHIRDADGCRFVAPAGAWLKFEFEGAVKRPVFRWIDA